MTKTVGPSYSEKLNVRWDGKGPVDSVDCFMESRVSIDIIFNLNLFVNRRFCGKLL